MRWIIFAAVVVVCAVQIQKVLSNRAELALTHKKQKKLERAADIAFRKITTEGGDKEIQALKLKITEDKLKTDKPHVIALLNKQLDGLKEAERIQREKEKTAVCLFSTLCAVHNPTCHYLEELTAMYGIKSTQDKEFIRFCDEKMGQKQWDALRQKAPDR